MIYIYRLSAFSRFYTNAVGVERMFNKTDLNYKIIVLIIMLCRAVCIVCFVLHNAQINHF